MSISKHDFEYPASKEKWNFRHYSLIKITFIFIFLLNTIFFFENSNLIFGIIYLFFKYKVYFYKSSSDIFRVRVIPPELGINIKKNMWIK